MNKKTQKKTQKDRLSQKGIFEEEPVTRQACRGCGRKVHPTDSGRVQFLCPNCGKGIIIRCSRCRKRAQIVKCPNCGFRYP